MAIAIVGISERSAAISSLFKETEDETDNVFKLASPSKDDCATKL